VDRLHTLGELARERTALVAVARNEGLTAEEALECVQDAICTFLGREEESDHALATLKTMVRNQARNFRRLHRRALPHLPWDDQLAEPGDNAEGMLAHAEDVVRLRLCVAELCGVQRAVVTLRLLEERSGEDVATTLGLTRGHVDVLVHRAKAALRVCMRHAT
jgi:RNA polymerase sigma-70 factor (ECF subfamily)